MKALFVEGGPLNGTIREVPDSTQVFECVGLNDVSIMITSLEPSASITRGRYERAVGLKGWFWLDNVYAIAIPFVWKGWL